MTPDVIRDLKGDPVRVPFDTNLLPMFEFFLAAVKKEKLLSIFFVIITLIVTVIGILISWIYGIYFTTAAVIIYYFVLDSYATRKQLVLRTGSAGEIYLEQQKWFKEDSDMFPDGAKYLYKNKRIGFWEVDYEGIRPFDAWSAPIKTEIEASKIGSIKGTMFAHHSMAAYQPMSAGDKLQMGMIAVVIAVCFIAVIMAVGQLGDNNDNQNPEIKEKTEITTGSNPNITR